MGDLRQRDAQVRVQLDDQGDDLGAELHAGSSQRIGGLQRVPTRNPAPALRAVADLDVEAAHDGTHHREVFLVLRRHAGTPRPRRRSPDTWPGPMPSSARRPAPDAGGTPAAHRLRRLAGRDARRARAAGPWRREPLAGVRPGARPPTASRGGRSAASGGRSHAAGRSLRRRRRSFSCCRPVPSRSRRVRSRRGSSSGGCGFRSWPPFPAEDARSSGTHELCHIVKHSTSTKSHLPAQERDPAKRIPLNYSPTRDSWTHRRGTPRLVFSSSRIWPWYR